MKREEHITYDDRLLGMVYLPRQKVFRPTKLHVRYSASNIADSISFSDDKDFMLQLDVKSLKKLLKKHGGEE